MSSLKLNNAQTQMKSGLNLNESLEPTIREVEQEIKQEEKIIECDAERDANFQMKVAEGCPLGSEGATWTIPTSRVDKVFELHRKRVPLANGCKENGIQEKEQD